MQAGVDYPDWMTPESLVTLSKNYLLKDETPKQMYERVAKASAKSLKRPKLAAKFFDIMWKGWLCPATPVLCNMGTDRGLPISCYGLSPADELDSIFTKAHESAMLTKGGGGVGVGMTGIRHRGASIKGLGEATGIVPWAKLYEVTMWGAKQGNIRKGAGSVNLSVDHPDFKEFLAIRDIKDGADPYLKTPFLNHCAVISDSFMKRVTAGEIAAKKLWREILKVRMRKGEPYLMFEGTVNRANPPGYTQRGFTVDMTNLCSEITLFSDKQHTFVCCLSSMNLTRWDEWKDTDAVYHATVFLDGVMQFYLDHAPIWPGHACAVRFAENSRAIGLGVLGYHTLLQEKLLPFDSLGSELLNRAIFQRIEGETNRASEDLAKEFGEPEWCKGTGKRFTHKMAVAPTLSNSAIAGSDSMGIEPIQGNIYLIQQAKGSFVRKNSRFLKLLRDKGKCTAAVQKSVLEHGGSCQHLDFLSKEEKDVFKTAFEIDQRAIVKQAAARQKHIDQAQSLSFFFAEDADPKYVNDTHLLAYKLGVKCCYYVHSTAPVKADTASRTVMKKAESGPTDCAACEG